MGSYNLIFDADDTLWENNVYFEQAIEGFIDHVDHPTLSRAEVRAVLDDVERVNCAVHGYGAHSFQRNTSDTLERLRPGAPVTDADQEALRRLVAPLVDFRVELIDGVAPTLRALGERHRLFLLTKGPHEDQQRKVDASGLAELFAGIGIVPEKHVGVYREFGATHGLDPADTWMIGNSPKSDILPALEAGLGAVLVPHEMTWSLEHAGLPENHGRFHQVSPISRLAELF